jgi:hypothetical protein
LVGGKSRLELGGDALFQRRLIVFDGKEVMPSPVADGLAHLALAEHRIPGNHPPFQHQGFQ